MSEPERSEQDIISWTHIYTFDFVLFFSRSFRHREISTDNSIPIVEPCSDSVARSRRSPII
jgi:hypothetical protein